MRVGRRGVVLERLVMRDTVALGLAVATDVRGCARGLGDDAPVGRKGRRGGWLEPTLEEPPADVPGVEQIADVAPGHHHVVARRAIVEERLRIADDGTGDGG